MLALVAAAAAARLDAPSTALAALDADLARPDTPAAALAALDADLALDHLIDKEREMQASLRICRSPRGNLPSCGERGEIRRHDDLHRGIQVRTRGRAEARAVKPLAER